MEIGLDIVVCGLLTFLIGWHIGFLPSFLLEGIPLVDVIPTWTLAVMIALRLKRGGKERAPAQEGRPPVVIDVESEVTGSERVPPKLSVPPRLTGTDPR